MKVNNSHRIYEQNIINDSYDCEGSQLQSLLLTPGCNSLHVFS